MLDVPAGHDRFFLAVVRPASERRLPDLEAMAAAAHDARFEIFGPPPPFE